MSRKPKFRPVITKVKLNPEQAVLQCDCYDEDRLFYGSGPYPPQTYLNVCLTGKDVDDNFQYDLETGVS